MKQEPKTCNLSAALARLGGNVPLLKSLAGFLDEDAPGLLRRLKSAAEQRDGDELHRAAHSLKGLVINFDAERAAGAAERLERIGSLGDWGHAEEGVREMEEALATLGQELKMELARL
ncbi:MAG: Hpt domain-containing protein [Planctomycetaceae bacterium]